MPKFRQHRRTVVVARIGGGQPIVVSANTVRARHEAQRLCRLKHTHADSASASSHYIIPVFL